MPKTTMKKTSSKTQLDQGLEEALAEKRAGKVIGPFTTAQDAMDFLNAFQRLIVLVEQALREAAKLGQRYNPETVHWLLNLEDLALERKLAALERTPS
jgi:hypothetical protein